MLLIPLAALAFSVTVNGEEQKLFDELTEELNLDRTGYQGIDVFLFLLAFFISGQLGSLKEFASRTARWGRQLAGMGGRKRWISQASLSRALQTVTPDQARSVTRLLLGPASDVMSLETDASVVYNDTQGQCWQVFHHDETKQVLRHRALPEGDDMPQPTRRCQTLAAPGHSRRKRGEMVLSRATLIHAGSALWRDLSLHAGAAPLEEVLDEANRCIEAWAERMGQPVERCLLVTDGISNGHVQVRVGCRSPVRFLARFGELGLLDEPDCRARLASEQWERVEEVRRSRREIGLLRPSRSRAGADRSTRRSASPSPRRTRAPRSPRSGCARCPTRRPCRRATDLLPRGDRLPLR